MRTGMFKLAITTAICLITTMNAAAQSDLVLLKPAKLHATASSASTTKKVVWKNEACTELDRKGVWVRVRMSEGKETGWIHSQYLKEKRTEPTAPEPEYPMHPNGSLLQLSKPAKLHAQASSPSEVLEIAFKGDRCIKLQQEQNWLRVELNKNGHRGWIHASYLIPAE